MVRLVGWAIAAVLLAQVSLARADNKTFAQWRDKARPVESLSQFLSSFVGDCESEILTGSKECQSKVDAFRKESLSNAYYVILGEDATKMVQVKGFNPQTHEFEFALTPLFDAAGYALTHGQPTHTDAEGNAVLPLMKMVGKLSDETTPMDVDRLFKTGQVRLQVVFRPMGIWRLPRKDKKGAFFEGVKSQFLAVRLSDARSGNELVSTVTATK
jgi:hypothetical protein